MKNRGCVILLILFIVIFSTVGFYFWFNYFLKLAGDGKLSGFNKNNNFIVMVEENNIHVEYEEGSDYPTLEDGYKFHIENRGKVSANYRLIFKELEPSQVNDGCSITNYLNADELNYQLLFNGQIIGEGVVSQIKNQVFDIRDIQFTNNNYELKVWLNTSSENNEGKHYHYKVELEVVEE